MKNNTNTDNQDQTEEWEDEFEMLFDRCMEPEWTGHFYKIEDVAMMATEHSLKAFIKLTIQSEKEKMLEIYESSVLHSIQYYEGDALVKELKWVIGDMGRFKSQLTENRKDK